MELTEQEMLPWWVFCSESSGLKEPDISGRREETAGSRQRLTGKS